MVGHEEKIKIFKNAADGGKLFHAYLFYGEPQIGKFFFALSLANYLENKKFDAESANNLSELLVIAPDENKTIGIDEAKRVIEFAYRKPVLSEKRAVIVRDAENLTVQAQNAVLKIVEEPPLQTLIIFVAREPDSLLPALVSRLQKIYFRKVSRGEIENFLVNEKKLNSKSAREIAEESFGRIGRAVDLATGGHSEMKELAERFLANLKDGDLFDRIVENDIDRFFEFLIIELRRNKYGNGRNFPLAREALKRLALIKMFNVNKKLQLKAIRQ